MTIVSLLSAIAHELRQGLQHLELIDIHLVEFSIMGVHPPDVIRIGAGQHPVEFAGTLVIRPARPRKDSPGAPAEEAGEFGRRRTFPIGVPHRRPDHSGGIVSSCAICESSFWASQATAAGFIPSTSSAWMVFKIPALQPART